MLDIQSLRRWGSHLKGQWQRTFEGRYENLLSLLSIEVQPIALSALTQFYDPPLRCFTFKDFQLALTVEEYERLLGMPLAKSPPYFPKGHYPSWASVAKLLRVPELEGIPRASLEEKLQQLQKEEDWLAFIDVYGLLIYDRGLCGPGSYRRPSWQTRPRGKPVIAVLANTYYTLNYCYRKNEKGLRCCTSLLYLWMIAHLFHGKKKTRLPDRGPSLELHQTTNESEVDHLLGRGHEKDNSLVPTMERKGECDHKVRRISKPPPYGYPRSHQLQS
ncbi:hypothetical protein CR513_63040, partial [Mucuna pruriens]